MSKWTNIDAGPTQAKRVETALGKLQWEGKTFVELTGVIGRPDSEHRTTFTEPFGTVRADVVAAALTLGEQFGWQVTKANHKAIVDAAAEAIIELQAHRPVRDSRDSPEARDEQVATVAVRSAEMEARREAHLVLAAEAQAQAPPDARAIILAVLKEDTSDVMTDYFANSSTRTVAIGWRSGRREDFRQLRAAAVTFPDTAHLGPEADADIEHRDNYSMGRGNYLSDHGWDGSGSGWIVKSRSVEAAAHWDLTEIAFPGGTTPAEVDHEAVQPEATPIPDTEPDPEAAPDAPVELEWLDEAPTPAPAVKRPKLRRRASRPYGRLGGPELLPLIAAGDADALLEGALRRNRKVRKAIAEQAKENA